MKKLFIALSLLLCITCLIVSCKSGRINQLATDSSGSGESVITTDLNSQDPATDPVTIAPDESTEEPIEPTEEPTGTTEEPAGTTSSKETTSPTGTKDPVAPSEPAGTTEEPTQSTEPEGTTEEPTQSTEPEGTTEPGAPDFDITEDENGGYSNLLPF